MFYKNQSHHIYTVYVRCILDMMKQTNEHLVDSRVVTVTKEDYFFEEFGKVKFPVGERYIEFNGHILQRDTNYPQFLGLKKGQKLREDCYAFDNSYTLEHRYTILEEVEA